MKDLGSASARSFVNTVVLPLPFRIQSTAVQCKVGGTPTVYDTI